MNDIRRAYQNELYHHGIKGMKWGVRRYQNEDGSYTAAGQKRYFNKNGSLTKKGQREIYDYKNSKSYKKDTNSYSRKMQDRRYKMTSFIYGKKKANQIEYRVREQGARRETEESKAFLQQYIAKEVVSSLSKPLLNAGKAYLQTQHIRNMTYVNLNNQFVDAYAKQKGLKEYKKGFTLGLDAVNRGKKLVSKYGL